MNNTNSIIPPLQNTINDKATEKDNLIKVNAAGDDRNLAEHGKSPYYWYSVEDGFRLILWLRQHYLSYNKTVEANSGEEFVAFRENDNRILVTDPYYVDNFKNYLSDDIARVTATGEFSHLAPWVQMPTTILIPLLSGLHWRSVKIEINYLNHTTCIVYDDPYGPGYFPTSLKSMIEPIIRSNIEKLIKIQNKDDAYKLIKDDIQVYETPVDQQGHGENSWDCGPITFSNIESHIKYGLGQTKEYIVPDYKDVRHKEIIQNIRTNDRIRYSEVSGVALNQLKIDAIEQHVEEIKEHQNQKLKKLNLDGHLDISNLDPLEISIFFEILDNKRLFDDKGKVGNYTQSEIEYAYKVLQKSLTDQVISYNRVNDDRYKGFKDFLFELRKEATKEVSYTADKINERGHPNANLKLSSIVKQVLSDKEIRTLESFHYKVYKLLWQESEFRNLKFIYNFKFKISYQDRLIEIGESDNLLFWLLANNETEKVKFIIENYKLDIEDVLDCNQYKNNILHISALYGNHIVIGKIVHLYINGMISKDKFEYLINSRNESGTLPLGMAFINKLSHERLIKVTELFLLRGVFKANQYLNNKKGMDYSSDILWQEIGGFNILHIALKNKHSEILELLNKRIKKGSGSENDQYYINFKYPALNPNYHMYSPEKILGAQIIYLNDTNTKKDNYEKLYNLLSKLQQSQTTQEDQYDSGDSSDEDSPAYLYKQELLKISAVIKNYQETRRTEDNVEKDLGTYDQILNTPTKIKPRELPEEVVEHYKKMTVPHFHGVPFMQGQYNNLQRREVAKKLFQLNNKLLAPYLKNSNTKLEDNDDDKIDRVISGIHSRTSTATNGIDNLHEMIKASQEKLTLLKSTDLQLQHYLSDCYNLNPELFLKSLEKYVYEFQKSPIKFFWDKLKSIKTPPEDIVKYRFPFISTSKAPDHAVKYAIGTNVEEERGEKPLYPKYDTNGTPKHRLAGFLYIVTHSFIDIDSMESSKEIADITKLLKTGQFKENVIISHQLENSFFGGIDEKNIVAVIPIIYPNFKKGFKSGYHDGIWGLENRDSRLSNNFTKAKAVFKNQDFLPISPQSAAGKVILPAFVELAINLVKAITGFKGNELYYSAPDGQIQKYPEGFNRNPNYLSKAQMAIKSYIELKQGSSGKTKVTPEQQNGMIRHMILTEEKSKVSRELFPNKEMNSQKDKTGMKKVEDGINPVLEINDTKKHSEDLYKLITASHLGNTKEVIALLKTIDKKILIAQDPNGDTALHHAAYKGHKAIVELLLNEAPELINIYNKNGLSASLLTERNEYKEVSEINEKFASVKPIVLEEPSHIVEVIDNNKTQIEYLGDSISTIKDIMN
jgi:ankyrin repeat protein